MSVILATQQIVLDTLSQKYPTPKRAGRVVEDLPRKHSNSSTTKKNKKERKKKRHATISDRDSKRSIGMRAGQTDRCC
jgi:hypothetical protein